MAWSKTKQQLESFLCPALAGRVEYRATCYRYTIDKQGRCYMAADKKEIFNMNDESTGIRWYQTEQEIKNELQGHIPVSDEELDAARMDTGGKVPEERLAVIAANRKIQHCAKEIFTAQSVLCKSDFSAAANAFLSASIEDCLNSNDILMNVFALVDRRIGKKRLLGLQQCMQLKHPVVQYFYQLRCSTL